MNTKKQLVPTNANFAPAIHLQALSKQLARWSSEVLYVIVPSSGVGAQSAAPWWGQWCCIYDFIVLSRPWYDLLFFEDLFARTFA